MTRLEHRLTDANEELRAEIARLREALTEIADMNKVPYVQIGDDPNESGPTVMLDGQFAKIARAALKQSDKGD